MTAGRHFKMGVRTELTHIAIYMVIFAALGLLVNVFDRRVSPVTACWQGALKGLAISVLIRYVALPIADRIIAFQTRKRRASQQNRTK